MRFVEKFHKSKILREETEMYNHNDGWASVIVLFVLVASLMGMFLIADEQGYKKGVNETLVLCMEKPADCKIKYDYLKLQENQK